MLYRNPIPAIKASPGSHQECCIPFRSSGVENRDTAKHKIPDTFALLGQQPCPASVSRTGNARAISQGHTTIDVVQNLSTDLATDLMVGLRICLDRLTVHHTRLKTRLGTRGSENGRCLSALHMHNRCSWCRKWQRRTLLRTRCSEVHRLSSVWGVRQTNVRCSTRLISEPFV